MNTTSSLEALYAELTDYCLLHLSGPDSEKFLQGQATCDLLELTRERALIGSANTPKGRTYGVFLIARIEDGMLLRLPAGIASECKARLDKYRIFFKTQLEFYDRYKVIGIYGAAAEQTVTERFGPLPAKDLEVTRGEDYFIVRQPGAPVRYELWTSRTSDCTAEGVSNQANALWHWLETSAGVAIMSPDIIDEFVPQMLNLQALGAISFKKGCYTGQEIVARMRYLGKLKKRLYLFQIESDLEIPANTPLQTPDGQKCGQVVQSASYQNRTRLLAVVDNDCMAQRLPVMLASHPADELSPLELPYEVS